MKSDSALREALSHLEQAQELLVQVLAERPPDAKLDLRGKSSKADDEDMEELAGEDTEESDGGDLAKLTKVIVQTPKASHRVKHVYPTPEEVLGVLTTEAQGSAEVARALGHAFPQIVATVLKRLIEDKKVVMVGVRKGAKYRLSTFHDMPDDPEP